MRNTYRNRSRRGSYGSNNGGYRNENPYGSRNDYRSEGHGDYRNEEREGREYDEDYDIRAGRERGMYSGDEQRSSRYSGGSNRGGGRIRNAISRAGERIRDTWNDWTDRDERDEDYDRGYEGEDYSRNIGNYEDRYNEPERGRGYGEYSRGGEGMRGGLRRAGERMRETWNDWTDRDDRDDRDYRSDYENPYGSRQNNYSRGRDRRPYGEENENRGTGRARRRVNAYTW